MKWLDAASDAATLKTLIIAAAVFAATAAVLFIARRLFFRYLHRWAGRTNTAADDVILEAIRHPSLFWVVALALYVALDTSSFPERYVGHGLKALYVLIVLSITMAAANITSKLVQGAIEGSTAGAPVSGLSRTIIRAVIFSIGGLVLLNGLGVSITPILTALGVGGLAVALALQNTLSNLFAGIHILVEKPVRVGDYMKLSEGNEGFVSDIGWRTTRVREVTGNIIIIPNSKLAQSVLTNYSLPDTRVAIVMKFPLAQDSDIDLAEAIIKDEAAKAASRISGLVRDIQPAVRLSQGLTESAVEFTVVLIADEFAVKADAEHEARKMILKRLKLEGVGLYCPTRNVRML